MAIYVFEHGHVCGAGRHVFSEARMGREAGDEEAVDRRTDETPPQKI